MPDWLALARGVWVAALFVVAGSALARVVVLPPALARLEPAEATLLDARWRRLVQAALVVALAAGSAWTWLVAGQLADDRDTAQTAAVLLRGTVFGHSILAQAALLGGVAVAVRLRRHALGAASAGLAVALQAAHSHAFAMHGNGGLLLLAAVLHLVAGAAWLGGLPALVLVLARPPAGPAALACRRFSGLGIACVVILCVTAAVQSWILIGGLPGLVGTAYGLAALLKAALFVGLLTFAARHRLGLTPALVGSAAEPARRRLAASVAAQGALGLLVVLTASTLAGLPPAVHVQPAWPFPVMPSLVALQEDEELAREVVAAGLALAGAAVLLGLAAVMRHWLRWPAAALALAVAWRAAPHLDLLLVEAHPTSFERSPTGFAAAGIVRGEALFAAHCAACHGAVGQGDGAAAAGSDIPPADLTAAHLWMHSDGELIWWLSHGMATPAGKPAMPGFSAVLEDDQLWELIDYIRAHNAGMAKARDGRWPLPVQAPAFRALCGSGELATAELRGQVLRLAFGPDAPEVAAPAGVTTVLVTGDPSVRPGAGLCVARDQAVSRAYAVVSGRESGAMERVEILVDGGGWLRDLRDRDAAFGWDNPAVLAGALARIRADPLAAAPDQHAGMSMPP